MIAFRKNSKPYLAKSYSYLFILTAFLSPHLLLAQGNRQQAEALNDPVKVLQATPVYSQPSAKSKALADIDPDTLLTIKKVSPKGTWIFVEDVDGNQGWIPRERTDFFQAPSSTQPLPSKPEATPLVGPEAEARRKEAEQAKQDAQKNADEDNDRQSQSSQSRHMLGTGMRMADLESTGPASAGIVYALMMLSQESSYGAKVIGLHTGILSSLQKNNSNYQIPIRYRVLSQDQLVGLSYWSGADVGALYAKGGRWSLSLGYNFVWGALANAGFIALLRGGIEFFPKARPSLEGVLAWTF